MLPEIDHFKILEQKRLGQGRCNRNRNKGVRDRIKAQQDNCLFDITDFGSKSIKKAASVLRTRPFFLGLMLLLILTRKQGCNRGGLGMRKDKDQSNDERINTQRLDQSQSDQHGNGYLT